MEYEFDSLTGLIVVGGPDPWTWHPYFTTNLHPFRCNARRGYAAYTASETV